MTPHQQRAQDATVRILRQFADQAESFSVSVCREAK